MKVGYCMTLEDDSRGGSSCVIAVKTAPRRTPACKSNKRHIEQYTFRDDLTEERKMTTDLDGATIDAARNALQRVLESPDFDASKRNCDFLRFVVEETLGGRSDRIKAYSIATLVFGRDENFDPQADPVVRFEARRLRRSLERYYLLSGKDDPIQITIPKGSYIPAFSASEDDQAAPAEAPSLSENAPREIMEYGHGPTILVLPFETEGDDPYAASLGRGCRTNAVQGPFRLWLGNQSAVELGIRFKDYAS